MVSESWKESANRMTELIESCWDENNPDDGLNFDERLSKKITDLKGQDKVVMNEILCGDIL